MTIIYLNDLNLHATALIYHFAKKIHLASSSSSPRRWSIPSCPGRPAEGSAFEDGVFARASLTTPHPPPDRAYALASAASSLAILDFSPL